MKLINGKHERVLHYISKATDLMECYLNNGKLRVIGVYCDGSVVKTELNGYIKNITCDSYETNLHHVETSTCLNGNKLKVFVI